MKVKVKRVNAVAVWKWNVPNDDVCGICRVPFDGCCPDCHVPGDDCPILTGQCKHVFHMYSCAAYLLHIFPFVLRALAYLCRHCIEKWLNTPDSKSQCPMDRQPWGMSFGRSVLTVF
jgi:anaphase-promoting complex subunit 11